MHYHLYRLTFPDGKQYIGYTSQPARRIADHKKPTGKGSNGMPLMSILCTGSRDYIIELEAKTIIAFRTNDPEIGYNIGIGRKLSPITRLKISKARIGQKLSLATRRKMKGRKTWNKGIPRTPEERAAIKAGLDHSDKTLGARAKLAELNRSRAGIRLAKKTRAKISAILKGKPKSPEHRAKISATKSRQHSSPHAVVE